MIYLTGDTHIPIDIHRLNVKQFWEQRDMTRDDYVIVLGDFGLLWHRNREYLYWLTWLQQKPFTVLWLDGNHENHDWIQNLPVQTWHGGNVHFIADNIIHLMRGQIYDLQGKSFFVMGGAMSIDREFRAEGESWWESEVPSQKEGRQGLDAIQHYHNNGKHIDYVLTHTCPGSIIHPMFQMHSAGDPTTDLLDTVREYVEDEMEGWYFGHWHMNKDMGKYHCLYNKIKKLF